MFSKFNAKIKVILKLSTEKKSYPGRKQVYRIEENGKFTHDVLALEDEIIEGTPLLEKVVENGERIVPRRDLNEIRKYCLEQVAKIPQTVREIKATYTYELRISPRLKNLTEDLERKYGGKK